MAKIYRCLLAVFVASELLGPGAFPDLNAQPAPSPHAALEKDLARAESYLFSHPDSVLVITGRLLTLLRARNQADSPVGLRVQLTQASAFEKSRYDDDLALPKLLRIEQLSREKGLWRIHAHACLILALVYEKNDLFDQSRQQLNLAKADLDRHGLGDVYPRFAVRMSSWHRQVKHRDSALFFAREAVRTASRYGSISDEADGLLLIAFLGDKSERVAYFLAAAALYRKMGHQEMYISMTLNIAHTYFLAKNFPLALTYYDSVLVGSRRLMAAGQKAPGVIFIQEAYQFRGEIYQQMGRLDSALANTKRGYELQLKVQELRDKEKIREIDARYQTQLKQKQIEEQQLALQLKTDQLRFSLIIAVLVGVSAVGLWLAYRRQRQAKQQVLAQNALVHSQAQQLRSLDAAKSRFFANVAHELRTPLTLLLGPISTLMAEECLNDKQTHLLQLAQRSGSQLDQLITDLLNLGKLELGRMELDPKPTSLAAFFSGHFAQFASLAERRHLHYAFDVAVADGAVADLDQSKCRQILNNLLSNAFKFTPSGGRITASLHLTDGHLHLRVADTGPGIHPDDRPHLFERYFQTTRLNKPAEGGTGIGLALCQEYTRLMGGTIAVESTLGAGSVFRVQWPVVLRVGETPVPVEEISVPVLEPVSGEKEFEIGSDLTVLTQSPLSTAQRPTLLVVEDHPDLLAYIRLILADTYEIVSAENGQVALDRLREEGSASISLVLSDLMMPVLDGYQLLEALKADDATRYLPVVMLTARADAGDKLRALRIGVDDYLLKPFDEAELRARIANLLANQAARRQAVAEEPPADPARPLMTPADRNWLEAVEGYVRQRTADPVLSVPALAHHFAMSESTLLRQLKRMTGLSPLQYVQAVRLEEARRLLESRQAHSVAQVAAAVGYADVRSFSRSFRARFGKLPSEVLEG